MDWRGAILKWSWNVIGAYFGFVGTIMILVFGLAAGVGLALWIFLDIGVAFMAASYIWPSIEPRTRGTFRIAYLEGELGTGEPHPEFVVVVTRAYGKKTHQEALERFQKEKPGAKVTRVERVD